MPKNNVFCVFNKLSDYRKQGLFCDVQLKVGDRVYPCHKNILAAKCTYFEKMFTGEFQEKEAEAVPLLDLDPSCFEDILEYIYTHRLKINKEKAFFMLKQGNYLHLEDMEKKCKKYIIDTASSVYYLLEICEFAHLIEETVFLEKLTREVATNFKKHSKCEQFFNISFEVLDGILNSLSLIQNSENEIPESEKLTVIIDWVKHDTDKRTGHLEKLLKYVTLPQDFHGVLTNTFVDYISNVMLTDSASLNIFCATCTKKEAIKPDVAMIMFKNDGWSWRKDVCKENLTFRAIVNDKQKYFLTYGVEDGKHANHFFKNKSEENELQSPPVLVKSYSLAAIGGTIFLYNSSDKFEPIGTAVSWTNLNSEEVTMNSVFAFNVDLNKWFSLATIPEYLYNSYLVSSDNLLYLIGGTTEYEISKSSRRNIVQVYDSRSAKWSKMEMTANNVQFSLNGAACAYNNKLYICERSRYPNSKGRSDEIIEYANILHVFDIKTQHWHRYDIEMEVPLPHVFIPYKTKLWLFGYDAGLKGAIYDPKSNSWARMPKLPEKIQTSYGLTKICRTLDAVVC